MMFQIVIELQKHAVQMSNQIEYQEKVNGEFAEAVYQEMASIRYGIDFCCSPDLSKWSIKKELLDSNALNQNIDLCPQDNPPQPGDRNYVPGPCGVIDVAYGAEGGSLRYVPCNAYIFRTVEYAAGESGTDRICYDTNVGFTIEGDVTATVSEEECDQPPVPEERTCYVFLASVGGKQTGSVTYLPCGADEPITVDLFGETDAGDRVIGCYDVTQDIVTGGAAVVTAGQTPCDNDDKICQTITFTLSAPTIEGTTRAGNASGVDCNGDFFIFDESLTWFNGIEDWVSPPVCVNLKETLLVQGDMQTIQGETCE